MGASRWRRGLRSVTRRRDDALARLDPSAFEALVAEHYRRQGYQVERVGHGGAHFDGGLDLKLRRAEEYIVVQCKRENAYQVTHNVGHELIGVMCTQGATGAIVVNTGEFTEHARSSAQREPRLTLVDGDEVRRWFPELASPTAEPRWEPVSAGRESASRQPARDGRAKVVLAMACLGAVLLWQCSRPDPQAGDRRIQTAPAWPPASAAPPHQVPAPSESQVVSQPPSAQSMSTLSEQELKEWERKNRESMEILRETTPEIDLSP
jgi:restriction system protein